MRLKTLMFCLLAVLFAAWMPGWSSEPEPIPDDGEVAVALEAVTQPDPALAAKLDGALLAYLEHQTVCAPGGGGQVETCLPADADGKVVVDVIATEGYTTDQLIAELTPFGFEVRSTWERVVTGRLPVTQIGQLAGVAALQVASYPQTSSSAGSVPGQGDVAQLSNVIRQSFGLTGRGQRVGVISNSFNCLGGAAADRASGDLPKKVEVLSEVDSCAGFSNPDEGRAMLQIVHDVAPRSRLLFHTALRGIADFANGVRRLVDAGATVVVDDIIFYNEPWFQEGLIQQAVRDVANTYNAVYVTSAGNLRRTRSYESAFRPSSHDTGAAGVSHDFDPGSGDTNAMTISFPPGFNQIFLQWDQPFRSVSGGQGATTNLDLFLVTGSGPPLASSRSNNIATGEPFESIAFNNNGSGNVTLLLLVTRRAGPNPTLFRLLLPQAAATSFPSRSSGMIGHSNTREAISVGAADYRNTPAFGVSPPLIESFSSAGGTPVIFDKQGNRIDITPQKPEIVGPDNVSNTFFGAPDNDGDGFPNFPGTSAAAPHVAGLVAQLLQDQPWVRPGHIRKAIVKSGTDMDDTLTPAFDVGYDRLTGFGLLDATAALAYLRSPTDLIPLEQLLLKDRRVVVRFEGSDTPQAADLRLTSLGKIRDAQGADLYSVWRIRNSSHDADDIHIVTLKSADGTFAERFRVPAGTDSYALSTAAAGQASHTLRYEKTVVFEYDTSTGYVRTVLKLTGTVATSDSSQAGFVDATLVPDTF